MVNLVLILVAYVLKLKQHRKMEKNRTLSPLLGNLQSNGKADEQSVYSTTFSPVKWG